jgi:hypothetical protein
MSKQTEDFLIHINGPSSFIALPVGHDVSDAPDLKPAPTPRGIKEQQRSPARDLNQPTTQIDSIVASPLRSFKQCVLFQSPDRRSYDRRGNIEGRETPMSFADHARRSLTFSVLRK